ncbi:MAG: acyl-CoA dehydrogenase family protein [Deltaproteobacteria bacterium]|nr:acyl-CoA dehydrogenase family protein [Deltaproteobacteria bacterium]MBW2308017.1 acyl-CoA dehydrogenase family protein [Deltaproteobacteria bacterium]
MDFALTEEQKAMQEMARSFADNEIVPFADKWDEEHYYPREIVTKMGELGFFGTVIPEEYGGTNTGSGFMNMTILSEEIARASSSIRVAFNMQTVGPGLSILRYGNDTQKQQYIPLLVSADMVGCFAITEPDAGSDVLAIKTTAVLDGDHYVLNGTKTWVSNAPTADLCIVYAYTEPEKKSKGMSTFIVELKNVSGVSTQVLEKMGTRSSITGAVIFDDTRVPRENLLGEPGDGIKHIFTSLNQTRLSCAAGAVGVAQACLDSVTRYCTERVQFGQQVGQFQMNQDMIANMAVEVQAARLLTYQAAWQKDRGQLNNGLETSYAKYFAGEVAARAAHSAMKILGAYGYSTEYPVARYFRDAVLYQIVEGTANIQKMIIAMDQLGYRKANR